MSLVEISSYRQTLVRRCYGRNLDGLSTFQYLTEFFSFPFPFAVNIADHVIDILMQDTNASLITSAGIDIQSLPTILPFKTEVEQLQPMIQESSSNLDS